MAAALPSSAAGVLTPSACLSCLEIREERLPELVGSLLQSPFLLHIIPMVAPPITLAPDTGSPAPLRSDCDPTASLWRSRARSLRCHRHVQSPPLAGGTALLLDFLRVMDAAPPPGTNWLCFFHFFRRSHDPRVRTNWLPNIVGIFSSASCSYSV